MSSGQPRFGIWIPVYGNWAGTDPAVEKHDASFARAKKLLIAAEGLRFETALLAQHLINPRDQELDQLETWTATSALAALPLGETTEKGVSVDYQHPCSLTVPLPTLARTFR